EIGGIAVSKRLFREILAQTNPIAFEIVGSEVGRENISYAFELLGLDYSIDSLEWFMKEVLQAWGWFKVQHSRSEYNYELKLFHHYGPRWSSFLKSYLGSALELINEKGPEFTLSDKVVKLTFPIRKDVETSERIFTEN
ncbi:MAG: hypothetical protein ACRDF4_12350, partial [Rhabdochlamydiaceae bacterium]